MVEKFERLELLVDVQNSNRVTSKTLDKSQFRFPRIRLSVSNFTPIKSAI